MDISNIDTKLLVHVGTEFVVVAGLFVWVNRKISTTTDHIDNIERNLIQRMQKMEDQIRLQGSIITELSHRSLESNNRQPGSERYVPNKNVSSKRVPSDGNNKTSFPPQSVRTTIIDGEEVEYRDEFLDDLLKKELSDIDSERKHQNGIDETEISIDPESSLQTNQFANDLADVKKKS